MKTLYLVLIMLVFGQARDTNLDRAVTKLTQQIYERTASYGVYRVVLDFKTTHGVTYKLSKELKKAVLINRYFRDHFAVISDEYTDYVRRHGKSNEELSTARNARADYILKGEISPIDDNNVEIFLRLIDMRTMVVKVAASVIYPFSADDNHIKYYEKRKDYKFTGFYFTYGISKSDNLNFEEKLKNPSSFTLGFGWFGSTKINFGLKMDKFVLLAYNRKHADFNIPLNYYPIKEKDGELIQSSRTLNSFSANSFQVNYSFVPHITKRFSLTAGAFAEVGGFKVFYEDEDEEYYNPWYNTYDRNADGDYAELVEKFFNYGYSVGAYYVLGALGVRINYQKTLNKGNTSWETIEFGLMLAFY